MLDGLLGRSFAAKCKSLIKLTKSRIDVIRRKRKATEKFLKKDISDLLLNGLDINAYGRAEGLMVELTLSSCYGFVEHCCEFVLKRLSVMQQVSACPEDCRMAVSSLMFAAARFSDLPELRDLRQIFQERYENSMECYVNPEFAANLDFKSPTLEKKVCLMQEIASEFSVNWDSKAFKLRMSRSSTFAQDHNAGMPNRLNDYCKPPCGKDLTQKEIRNDVLLEKNHDHAKDGYIFQNGKEAVVLNRLDHDLQSKFTHPGNEFKPLNGHEVPWKRDGPGRENPLTGRQEVTVEKSDRGYSKEGSMLKPIGRSSQEKTVEQFEGGSKFNKSWVNTTPTRENQDRMLKSIGRSSQNQKKTVEQFEGGSKMHDNCGNTTPARETQDTKTTRKPPSHVKPPFSVNHVGLPGTDKTVKKIQRDETPALKPCYSNAIPPLRETHDTAARKSPRHAGLHFKSNVNDPFAVNHIDQLDTDKSERKIQKEETPTLKPCNSNAIPPPYVKQLNSKQQNSTRGANVVSSYANSNGISTYPSGHDKPEAASMSERIQIDLDNSDRDWQGGSRHERLGKQSREKEISIREEVTLVKPKSMRRKQSRSRPGYYDASNEDSGLERKSRSRSRRRDESRRGLQNLFDDECYQNAEEERIIDKLLIHYSKKPSILVPEKVRRNSKHAHLMDNTTTRELLQNESGDGSDETPEMVSLPPRSVSLPREQHRGVEAKKVFTRAATFEPVRSLEARHVHPKLPDYDDLAARFAALRGR
ncbi:hypothetical protein VNO77_00249 [Canavalia gladiata]|uniref:Vacuolar protein sorting-associated protein Ist1 n=1 Tax=Canavalia gladiata TaxID=3824 RepID=A0AAN9R3U1_CANGL